MKTLDVRPYRFSDVLAQITGVAAGLAVPLVVFRQTLDRGATGIVSTVSGIVSMAGAVADRYPRKPVIIGSCFLAGLLAFGLAWSALPGNFSVGLYGAPLCAFMFCYSIGQACADPSLPQLVAEEDIAAAQGFIQARMQCAGPIGLILGGALATRFIQRTLAFRTLMLVNTGFLAAALACAALVYDALAVVVPLGIAVLFAPAAGAVIYAKLVELIDEHAFGRVTTIQSTTVTTHSGVWNTPLGYITSAWSFLAGFWACAGLAVLGFATTFLFNSAVARASAPAADSAGSQRP